MRDVIYVKSDKIKPIYQQINWIFTILIFGIMKSLVIISLFETVRLSVSSPLRNLYNSLKSIKDIVILTPARVCRALR